MIIADTNVVSELMRASPDRSVMRWALRLPVADLYITSITLAEILYGIERLPNGKRKARIREAADEVFSTFTDQILSFDADAASHYSTIVHDRVRLGRPIDGFDAQIAAICRSRGAGLATRNVNDFERTGIDVTDPWTSGPAEG